ncbi:ribonuclease P protein component [bacterium DOLZORAL124_38_8]|nr:MAG: ribonuclease P protein component [bacterium DOLZORAL124_38_8]
MIQKKYRFTTNQFERAFLRSKKIFIQDFTFFVSHSPTHSRIGATVSKKNIKLAVHRNQIRRKMYEILRTELFPKLTQKNVICLYKGKTVENCANLKTIIPTLLQKIDLKFNH